MSISCISQCVCVRTCVCACFRGNVCMPLEPHQLLKAGEAVVFGVGEDPLVASTLGPEEGPDLCVVLLLQRTVASCLALEEIHLTLNTQKNTLVVQQVTVEH